MEEFQDMEVIMKFTVKKCLFTAFVMSASASFPMFNGQQGQGLQVALDPNDPIVQALNFYQCTNTLLDAGKSLYNVVKPVFGLTASLDADNPWRKNDVENSFRYVHRMLAHVTTLYGYSLYTRAISSKFTGKAKKFVKETLLEDYSKDFNTVYGEGCVDRAIKSVSHNREWKDKSQAVVMKHEQDTLKKGLESLSAAKSIAEKTRIRRKLLLQFHPDKAHTYKFDGVMIDRSSVNYELKAKRHTLYTSMINKVATDQGVAK